MSRPKTATEKAEEKADDKAEEKKAAADTELGIPEPAIPQPRSTNTLRDQRVIDPDGPDYPSFVNDKADRQGNDYEPGGTKAPKVEAE